MQPVAYLPLWTDEGGGERRRNSSASTSSASATRPSQSSVGLARPPSTSQKWLRETAALSGRCDNGVRFSRATALMRFTTR